MALSSKQRTAVFIVFLLLVLVSAGLEATIILKIVAAGDVGKLEGSIAILNALGLAALLKVFINMVKVLFAPTDMVSEAQLCAYFEGRLRSLTGSTTLMQNEERIRLTAELVRNCLRLAESVLKNWVGEYHYELSVFEDGQYPKIVAYYDSGGESEPRSRAAREEDPEYYRKRKYEVVELLDKPGNAVIWLADTRSGGHPYTFSSEVQKSKIGSTILYCFCNEGPRALVITCDKSKTLATDRRMETLVRALGTAMRAEYTHRNLVAASI